MSVQTMTADTPVRETVSAEEWQTRIELAACHRLLDHFGITDLTHNHLTARVPGEPDHMLIKRGDAMFDEVTASNLAKFDLDGNPCQEGTGKLRGGGLIIHAGLFAARDDVNAIFHTHTPAIIGVATQKHGLLPINQHGIRFIGKIAYHDFGGFEFDMDMREPLIRDLGDKNLALLRNHGSLVCGVSIGDVFVDHHNLNFACEAQIATLAGGGEYIEITPEVREYMENQNRADTVRRSNGGKDWVSCMRLADRLYPSFRD